MPFRKKEEKEKLKEAEKNTHHTQDSLGLDTSLPVKKKITSLFIAILSSVLVLLLVLFFLGIKIQFYVQDELQIKLEPLDKTVLVHRNQTENITFTLSPHSFPFCKTICAYELVDLRDNSILSNETSVFSSNERVQKTYLLNADSFGSGQLLFEFLVKCHNQKSFLCSTKEQEKIKTSFITLNYDLSETEKSLKEKLHSDLLNYFETLKQIDVILQRNDAILNTLSAIYETQPEEVITLLQEEEILQNNFISKSLASDQFISLWSQEHYADLSNTLTKQHFEEVINLKTFAEKRGQTIENLVSEHNLFTKELMSLLNSSNLLLRAEENYYFANEEEKGNEIQKYLFTLENLKENFILGNFSTYESIINLLNRSYYQQKIILSSYNLDVSLFYEDITEKIMLQKGMINELINLRDESLNNKETEIFFIPSKNESLQNICYDLSMLLNKTSNLNDDTEKIITEKVVNKTINESTDTLSNESTNNLQNVSTNTQTSEQNNKEELIASFLISAQNRGLKIERDVLQTIITSAEQNSSFSQSFSKNILDSFIYRLEHLPPIAENESQSDNYSEVILPFFSSKYCSSNKNSSLNISLPISPNFSLTILSTHELSFLQFPENNSFTTTLQINLTENKPTCCVFHTCKICCTFETCSNNPDLYPVIFIHGHSFNEDDTPETSLDSFAQIQKKLQDEGYINAGQVNLEADPTEVPYGEYGKSGHPISIRASYYYIQYFDVASYTISTQKSEKIENYAIRLKELVDLVKYRTGMKKVILVSHSMGGLVSREYLRIFGSQDVEKLIMIASPNHGIEGSSQKYCTVLGSQSECEDMSEESIFIKKLNAAIPPSVSMYNIAIGGCTTDEKEGDGIVTIKSAYLPYAKNINFTEVCPDSISDSLHVDILNPRLYPDVYQALIQFLKEKEKTIN